MADPALAMASKDHSGLHEDRRLAPHGKDTCNGDKGKLRCHGRRGALSGRATATGRQALHWDGAGRDLIV